MATIQSVISSLPHAAQPQPERESVRCEHCTLVQFKAASSNCRRCHKPLPLVLDQEPEKGLSEPQGPAIHNVEGSSLGIAAVVKSLRLHLGLSQRSLARIIGCPRTYISKIENRGVTPTLSSLERIADALKISLYRLIFSAEIYALGGSVTHEEVRYYLFEKKMLVAISQIPGEKRKQVLERLSDDSTIHELLLGTKPESV